MYNNKNYHPEVQRAESEMVLVTTKHGRYHMGLQSLTCIEYFETSGRTTGLRRSVNMAVTQTRLCLSRGIPDKLLSYTGIHTTTRLEAVVLRAQN